MILIYELRLHIDKITKNREKIDSSEATKSARNDNTDKRKEKKNTRKSQDLNF